MFKLKKIMARGSVLTALSLAAAAFGHNEGFRMFFTAQLEGSQVVPAVAGGGRGLLGITLNGHADSIALYGAVTGLSGPVTGLSIHSGAPGSNGTLFQEIGKASAGNSISGNLPVTLAEISKLTRGSYYLVVSTAAHPDGELRGQIELSRNRQFLAHLTGDGEAAPVATPASGLGAFWLSPGDSALTVKVSFGDLKDSITAAYLGYGRDGDAGALALDLMPYLAGGPGGGSLIGRIPLQASHGELAKGSASARAAHNELAEALADGNVFINIKTKAHADGEIRGGLKESDDRIFVADLDGSKQLPAVATSAKALGLFVLSEDDSTLTADASFPGVDSIAAVHVHSGSKTTNADTLPGEPQANLAAAASGSHAAKAIKVSSLGNPAAFLKSLFRGNIYVNVHSKAHPDGEIRGQLILPFRIGTALPLEGAQETPAVATKASGLAIVTRDPDGSNAAYAILADSLESPFAGAAIHKQAAGMAGDAVLDLTPSFDFNDDSLTGLYAGGAWYAVQAGQPFTPALANAFMAESLYVNIATRANASGELRGQIKDRVPALRVVGIIWAARKSGSNLRPRFVAEGNAVRLRAQPGTALKLDVMDLQGRLELSAALAIGGDGLSRRVDLSELGRGLHFIIASGGKASTGTARFLRR
jgi:CHRD domain-containing protein